MEEPQEKVIEELKRVSVKCLWAIILCLFHAKINKTIIL